MTPQQRWNAKHPDKMCEATRKYRAANSDKCKAELAEWKKANKDKVNEAQARRRANLLAQTLICC